MMLMRRSTRKQAPRINLKSHLEMEMIARVSIIRIQWEALMVIPVLWIMMAQCIQKRKSISMMSPLVEYNGRHRQADKNHQAKVTLVAMAVRA